MAAPIAALEDAGPIPSIDLYHKWEELPISNGGPPDLCMSLSGGGMRSAAFSIGVMAGLHDSGKLREVDAISAVSGGSYALGWYTVQSFYRMMSDTTLSRWDSDSDLFNPTGDYQRHIEQNARIATPYNLALDLTIGNILSLPLRLSVESFNDDFRDARNNYSDALRQAFFTDVSENYEDEISKRVGLKLVPSVGIVSKFVIDRRMPFFTFNGTSHISANAIKKTADSSVIFQMNPVWFGAPNVGFWESSDVSADGIFGWFDFHHLSAISGAAIDSKAFGPGAGLPITFLNGQLGYQLVRGREDANGTAHPVGWAYVTDGGHSENLGLFPLIQLKCRTIIVVDAEHDPAFHFSSYQILKEWLKRSHRIEFTVGMLEREDNPSSIPFQTGLISGPIGKPINIVYLKLMINRADLSQYPKYVAAYARRKPEFPQESTIDQDYTTDQYRAYRDLGRFVVQEHLAK